MANNPDPANYNKEYLLVQYQVISSRNQLQNNLLWQTPMFLLVTQTFLYSVVLSSQATYWIRIILSTLAVLINLLVLQQMMKHRFLEVQDSKYLECIEIILGLPAVHTSLNKRIDELKRINKAITFKQPTFVENIRTFYLWIIMLFLFLVTSILLLAGVIWNFV